MFKTYTHPNTIILDASFNPLYIQTANPNRFDFIFEERAKEDAAKAQEERIKGFAPEEDETEVFRCSPEEGKYYCTAVYTRKMGTYALKNEHYYAKTDTLKYVGQFIQTCRSGYGDGGQVWSIFDHYGEEVRVDYTYEGTTCFVETSAPGDYVFK